MHVLKVHLMTHTTQTVDDEEDDDQNAQQPTETNKKARYDSSRLLRLATRSQAVKK
jgi:hypothetical protein